jgi:SAM-dependent methyltransferase
MWFDRKISEWQLYQRKRYVTLMAEDAFDRLRGRADPELPSKHLRDFVGGGDFRAVGEEFARYARDLAGLRPEDHVLEIGSGIGRIALPLTRIIGPQGSYDGLEIVPRGVRWCQKHITPGHPNFQFHHADIANSTYNRRGRIKAEQYTFPFPPDSFDVVLLTSVFTHLLPPATAHYLSEIERVLAPGGRMLATFYLLNDESLALMESGRTVVGFPHAVDGARVADLAAPENVVALPETLVRDLLEHAALPPGEVHYGSWCPREAPLSHQDMVVVTKP